MDTTLTTDCTANENNIYMEKSKLEILCPQSTIHFTLMKTKTSEQRIIWDTFICWSTESNKTLKTSVVFHFQFIWLYLPSAVYNEFSGIIIKTDLFMSHKHSMVCTLHSLAKWIKKLWIGSTDSTYQRTRNILISFKEPRSKYYMHIYMVSAIDS
jgi:hypothetical protein